jgi:AraC-like DNA-binding protein
MSATARADTINGSCALSRGLNKQLGMNYYIPAPPLDAYINYIYYRDTPMPGPRALLLPGPSLNLEINFGAAFRVSTPARAAPFAHCAESWVAGLRDTPHIIDWPHDIRILIVDFKPGAAFPLLQLPLCELNNRVVSLDMLWGRLAAELRERLYAAPTAEARFALLEQVLRERLCQAPRGFELVQHAVAEIARRRGTLSIKALSEQLGLSQKHLITQFKHLVGRTPKELARLYRLQHAIKQIEPAQTVQWAWVAQQACYYDQAHFVNDWKAFTGYAPTEYLALRRRMDVDNPRDVAGLLHLPFG